MKTVVSEKGQVTIPKKIRSQFGLEAGTVLEFEPREGEIVISKERKESSIDKWLGFAKLPEGETVDSYLDSIRER